MPQWVLDEAVGRPAQHDVWRGGPPVLGPAAGGARWRRVLGVGVVLAVVGVAAFSGVLPGLPGLGSTPDVAVAGPPVPSPGFEEHEQPLGEPAAVIVASSAHSWMQTGVDGGPVRWDPCRPVHLVVRPQDAPPGGEELVVAAAAEVSRVTGLEIVVDGSTDEAELDDRAPFQPERYGDRWAPVIVAWVTADENPDFAAGLAGQAGPQAVWSVSGGPVYVSGRVELDAPWFTSALAAPGGAVHARAVVLHELGHLVGLDHVNDPGELMHADNVGLLDFGPGDLTGLAELGRGSCVPDV